MTNKELLHASMLDILFDGRNKEYGAYALRKEYNHRLLLALGLGLSVMLVFIFINSLHGSDRSRKAVVPQKEELIVRQYNEDRAVKQPEVQNPKTAAQPPTENAATVKNTTLRFIDTNEPIETEVPTAEMLEENATGMETKAGEQDKAIIPVDPDQKSSGIQETAAVPEPVKPSYGPEFPGGFESLKKWLAQNLVTPDALEAGQVKTVKARFIVDKDGRISTVEILVSGGNDFDKEVIRVCKKMPRWKAAVQNGEPVLTNYILPVTFMGIE